MPFSVTQWPKEPDPRAPAYIVNGWNVGQLSPWKWVVSTTGATGALSIFNAGILCHNTFNSASFGNFETDDTLPGSLALVFTIAGTELPAGGPPTFTIAVNMQFFFITTLLYTAVLRVTYPTALQVQTGFTMVEFDTGHGTFINPVLITPAKWNS